MITRDFRKVKRILSGLILVIALVGCDSIEEMKGFFEKQELMIEAIEKETGWESQVEYNMTKGVITHVSVTFDAEDVRDKKVLELEILIQKVVIEIFKETPQAININITTKL